MKSFTIGITGSTGFLGKQLIRYLSGKGFTLVCLVRKIPEEEDTCSKNIVYITGDIRKPASLVPFVKTLDVCIHLAAFVGYGLRKDYEEVNVHGTSLLCDCILQHNPSCRLIYCSSIAVLKRRKIFTFIDTDYAKSKYRGQKIVENNMKKRGLKASIVYSGMIYGPGDRNFVPTIIKNIKNEKIILISGGERRAPLIFIDDLCDLFYKISIDSSSVNHSYIGVKQNDAGIHDFLRLIARKTGAKEPVKKIPKALILIPAVIADEWHQLFRIENPPRLSKRIVDVLSISLKLSDKYFQNNIGWEAKIEMESGLEQYLTWLNDY